MTVHQDARLYLALLGDGERVMHPLAPGRRAWVHVARGEALVNGQPLSAGDGAALEGEPAVELAAAGASLADVLLFDLA